VDLLAPGDPIISTVPGIFCGAHGIDCFGWNRGTSMAAPHASGVAALVWSQLLQSNPTNTAQANRDEVIRRLKDCADHTGAMGQDMLIWSAHGRLNADGAVTCGPTSPPPPSPTGNYVSDLVGTSSASGPTWTATGTVTVLDANGIPAGNVPVMGSWDNGDPASCFTSSGQGQCSMVLPNIRKRVGSVVLTVDVPLDINGSPASVTISKQ
jgi:subtilisin family serine protease